MANTKSAAKSARQSVRRRARNTSVISSLKTEQKALRKALADGNAETAKAGVAKFSAALDKAAKRGVIHKNVANRKKSRLAKALAAKKA
ncbi:MAG: 30S ribosomal protein S20 [Terrimicrobiaceae bacterium]|nr:30S ribosomal protein S20 [Terrimicrobiaceae bacterium]